MLLLGNVYEFQNIVERAVILSQGNALQPEDFFLEPRQETAPSFDQTYQLEEVEKMLIIKNLKKFNGNITDAAREMGLTRQALYR